MEHENHVSPRMKNTIRNLMRGMPTPEARSAAVETAREASDPMTMMMEKMDSVMGMMKKMMGKMGMKEEMPDKKHKMDKEPHEEEDYPEE